MRRRRRKRSAPYRAGRRPCWTETARTASDIAVSAMRTMPSAASRTLKRSGSASFSLMACSAAPHVERHVAVQEALRIDAAPKPDSHR
jgi:hypothetical protein